MILEESGEAGPWADKGLLRKLRHWPPKLFGGRGLVWQKDPARGFEELVGVRHRLVHFRSAHETLEMPGVRFEGLADVSAYERLDAMYAMSALTHAEGVVTALFRVAGVPEAEIPHSLHGWTGRFPQLS